MIISIETESPVPPYEQIRSQIAMMASGGVLKEGSRLPTIRQLAADLGLAGGTVARAYRELEQSGIIRTRGRNGTFIEKAAPSPRIDEELRNAARSFALRAAQLGVDSRRAVESVRRALAERAASIGS